MNLLGADGWKIGPWLEIIVPGALRAPLSDKAWDRGLDLKQEINTK